MKKRVLIFSICFSLSCILPTYAEEYYQAKTVSEINETYYGVCPQYHWEEADGNWYYKDESGQTKYGKFYDDDGNIYDTGSNTDGRIILSGKNSSGEEFGPDGRLINKGVKGEERYQHMSGEYEKKKKIKFDGINDFLDFLEYYQTQYTLNDINLEFSLNTNSLTSTIGTYTYDREAVVKQILDKFGTLKGENDYEKIYDACEKIRTTFDYDLSYMKRSLPDSLSDNIGVCWQYSKIVSLLLDDAGIYNEIVAGKYKGADYNHMWIRCKVDDKWIYTDPTMFQSIGWSYYNINYQFYVDNYTNLKIIVS